MKDFSRALNYSFLLLKYRERSRFEIRSRLKDKGYSSGVIEQTINYLEENNYINDESFVAAFVVYSQDKGWGPRRIDFNLKKLGVSAELREKALKAAAGNYQENIREIIKQRLAQYKKSGINDLEIAD